MRRAVCLLSGGLDSATTLAIARDEGYTVHALSFRYGQKAEREVEAAENICRVYKEVVHKILAIDLSQIGGSALTDNIPIPLNESPSGKIPVTYVPARNTIFLSLALGYAEVIEAQDIFIGVNALDYSGYPDCRPDYIEAFEKMANLATRSAVQGRRFRIHTPLMSLNKAQIIRRGLSLGVDFALTVSCYQPTANGKACGRCESCRIRLRGFADAGVPDPIEYDCESGILSE
ncbi:7-cyano-7-deazaguanine synthase QueC [candidate division KSB1 bacterium]|nr:7-cyano-7-deazaguanine synthase QueC [candidate division KSB1 bacterium]